MRKNSRINLFSIFTIGLLLVMLGVVLIASRPKPSRTSIPQIPTPSVTPTPILTNQLVKSIPSPGSRYTYNLYHRTDSSCIFSITDTDGNEIDMSFKTDAYQTYCETMEGNWNSDFHSWISDTAFVRFKPVYGYEIVDVEKKTETLPKLTFSHSEYLLASMNKTGTRFLLRDFADDRQDRSGYQYVLFDQAGDRIGESIMSKASSDAIFYDPHNDGFVFVEMSWIEQGTMSAIQVTFYDLKRNTMRVLYTYSQESIHKGGCMIGNFTSEPGKIGFTNTEMQQGCFRSTPEYRDNTIYIKVN